MNEVFRPGGRALETGDTLLLQPALAGTLRALQANGADAPAHRSAPPSWPG